MISMSLFFSKMGLRNLVYLFGLFAHVLGQTAAPGVIDPSKLNWSFYAFYAPSLDNQVSGFKINWKPEPTIPMTTSRKNKETITLYTLEFLCCWANGV